MDTYKELVSKLHQNEIHSINYNIRNGGLPVRIRTTDGLFSPFIELCKLRDELRLSFDETINQYMTKCLDGWTDFFNSDFTIANQIIKYTNTFGHLPKIRGSGSYHNILKKWRNYVDDSYMSGKEFLICRPELDKYLEQNLTGWIEYKSISIFDKNKNKAIQMAHDIVNRIKQRNGVFPTYSRFDKQEYNDRSWLQSFNRTHTKYVHVCYPEVDQYLTKELGSLWTDLKTPGAIVAENTENIKKRAFNANENALMDALIDDAASESSDIFSSSDEDENIPTTKRTKT